MATSCSYGITGTSVSNASNIKSTYKVIDLTICVPSGTTPDSSFASACNAAGMSAILNNANDSGGGGENLGFYQSMKSAGWMGAGGETNSDDEINTVMDSGLIYIDYAGWTGPDSLRSIYSEGIKAHDGGIGAWFETYGSGDAPGVSYAGCGITTDVMANMATQAHNAGAKEVGLLIGNWHLDWGAEPYMALATAIENSIASFAGFLIWVGYAVNAYSSCDAQASAASSLLSALQSSWPAQTQYTMAQRFGGSGGGSVQSNSQPGVCSTAANSLDLFCRGSDAAAWENSYTDANGWGGWGSLGGQGASDTWVGAAAGFATGREDMFIQGTDTTVWHKTNTGTWESIGGAATGGPAAVVSTPGRVDVFVRGTDGNLWQNYYLSGWNGWNSLGIALATGTGPAACSWGGGRIDLFYTGTDNACHHLYYTGSGSWSSPESLGGVSNGSPAACSWATNRVDVFVVGSDGGIYHKAYWNGWQGWESLSGIAVLGTGAACCSWGDNHLDVFVLGTDGNFWQNTWDSGSWAGWRVLGGSAIPSNALLFASANEIDVLDYLTKSHNGQPTPGSHKVEVFLPSGKSNVNLSAKVREYQPKSG